MKSVSTKGPNSPPAFSSGWSGSTDEGAFDNPLLKATLNAAVDGIVVVCNQSIIRLFNQGAEKLFGYTSDEIIGRSVNVLMPEPQKHEHESFVNRYLATGRRRVIGMGRKVQAVNKRGEVIPIQISLGEFEVNGEPMFVAITRDMREQSDLESALEEERQKSRNLQHNLSKVYQSSLLAELLASIAHEINQPLAAITTYADVSRRVLDSDSDYLDGIKSNLEKISNQALRAGEVIQHMRDMAPKSSLVKEKAVVNGMIVELMDLINTEARAAGCEVRIALDSELPPVWANTTQIQHVLLLLLRNSLESLTSDKDREQGIIITVQRHSSGYIQLAVIDHGIGIDSAILDTLYHPFTSSKADKMGIGLSVCSTIIGNHGGRIWHEPNPKGGSCFIFTLPVHAQ